MFFQPPVVIIFTDFLLLPFFFLPFWEVARKQCKGLLRNLFFDVGYLKFALYHFCYPKRSIRTICQNFMIWFWWLVIPTMLHCVVEYVDLDMCIWLDRIWQQWTSNRNYIIIRTVVSFVYFLESHIKFQKKYSLFNLRKTL